MSLPDLLKPFDHFFFDLDGVIWECESLLPGAQKLLSLLSSSSKSIYYISNNTNHSRSSFHSLFTSLSLPSSLPNILCAAYNTSLYLQSNLPPQSKVFVIGSQNFCEEISSAGFSVISSIPMEDTRMTTTELGNLEVDPDIKAVAVGYTTKLNFYSLSYAVNCLYQGALLVTSNYDSCDKAGKFNVPGSACTVEFLRYSLNADFVNIGKPEKWAIENVIQRDGLDREKCLIFGDKMMTDVLLGVNCGVKTVLVLTGVEDEESYKRYEFEPDFVVKGLSDLID